MAGSRKFAKLIMAGNYEVVNLKILPEFICIVFNINVVHFQKLDYDYDC